MANSALGLPDTITACLFDLDGVLTQTAKVHAAAWQEMFDEFLRRRSDETGDPFVPFDPDDDYNTYVDGKPRADGTRSFLESRDISLPDGDAEDPGDRDTIAGLGNRKNELVLQHIRDDGVETYAGSMRYLDAVLEAGLICAVVSSSTNTRAVLETTGIAELFSARIDGVVATERGLEGKPAPDTYLAGAEAVGVRPEHAAVFEDALSGVAAGKAGDFGIVVGVDRVGQRDELLAHGADVVVEDLADLLKD